MIYVTGDYHGGIDAADRFEPWEFIEGAELTRGDYVAVMGDFGVPSADGGELRAFRRYPWTTLFVDGNHEDYEYLGRLPVTEWRGGKVHRYHDAPIVHLMRGQVYEFGGMRVFTMGGAKSVIAGDRVWPQEMPDDGEYAEALANLERVNYQVDYVFTHACPTRFLASALGWGGRFAVVSDELTDFLDGVWERIDARRLRRWYCGHYHNEAIVADSGGKLVCLHRSVLPLGGTF